MINDHFQKTAWKNQQMDLFPFEITEAGSDLKKIAKLLD
jgi:hypothetical protein